MSIIIRKPVFSPFLPLLVLFHHQQILVNKKQALSFQIESVDL